MYVVRRGQQHLHMRLHAACAAALGLRAAYQCTECPEHACYILFRPDTGLCLLLRGGLRPRGATAQPHKRANALHCTAMHVLRSRGRAHAARAACQARFRPCGCHTSTDMRSLFCLFTRASAGCCDTAWRPGHARSWLHVPARNQASVATPGGVCLRHACSASAYAAGRLAGTLSAPGALRHTTLLSPSLAPSLCTVADVLRCDARSLQSLRVSFSARKGAQHHHFNADQRHS